MAKPIYLIDIVAAVDSAGTTTTLRYCSGDGFTTKPSETPANTFYDPRVKQPALMTRNIYSSGTTTGQSSVGYGEVVLVNTDGGLDALIDYGFDGRAITIRYGLDNAAYPSGFTTVFTGTMEQADFRWKEISINIKDRQAEFASKKLQTSKYAGDNALPNGLEGVEGDIKARPKPVCYGKVYNVQPPMVNTSRLIYQVNDGAVSSVDKVYDRGVALTKEADYTSQSDMETNMPSAGAFRVWPGGGYFRLGSSAVGTLTADVVQGAAASNRTVAQIIKTVSIDRGGVASGDVVSADVTALDTANSAEVGIWVDSESDISSVLDELANSIGAWWGFDNTGKLRMVRLSSPSGSPVITLTKTDIIDIDRSGTSDAGRGVPAYSCKLFYKKLYTTQDTDLAGSVTDARRNEIKVEYRETVSKDDTVKNKHPLAPELEFHTLLIDASAASTEAARLLAIYKVRRDVVTCQIRTETLLNLNLGDVVSVLIDRFGYNAGKLFKIIGIETDYKRNEIKLTLWG